MDQTRHLQLLEEQLREADRVIRDTGRALEVAAKFFGCVDEQCDHTECVPEVIENIRAGARRLGRAVIRLLGRASMVPEQSLLPLGPPVGCGRDLLIGSCGGGGGRYCADCRSKVRAS